MRLPSSATAWSLIPACSSREMAMLEAEGISCKNLKISCDAHVIMPYHKDFDGADEKRLGEEQDRHHEARHRPLLPGQSGPARAFASRNLLDEKIFRLKLEAVLSQKNAHPREDLRPAHLHGGGDLRGGNLPYARILKPYMAETAPAAERGRARRQVHPVRGRAGHATRHRPTARTPTSRPRRAAPAAPPTGTGVGPTVIDRVLASRRPTSRAWATAPSPRRQRFPEGRRRRRGGRGRRSCCARWATSSA